MAFEKMIKHFRQSNTNRNPDYVGMACRRHGTYSLTAIVTIGSDVTARLNWQRKDRINAERGTDADLGTLRLSKGDLSGFSLTRSGGNANNGVLIFHGLAAPEKYPAAPVEYKIKNGALYITLPEWARG